MLFINWTYVMRSTGHTETARFRWLAFGAKTSKIVADYSERASVPLSVLCIRTRGGRSVFLCADCHSQLCSGSATTVIVRHRRLFLTQNFTLAFLCAFCFFFVSTFLLIPFVGCQMCACVRLSGISWLVGVHVCGDYEPSASRPPHRRHLPQNPFWHTMSSNCSDRLNAVERHTTSAPANVRFSYIIHGVYLYMGCHYIVLLRLRLRLYLSACVGPFYGLVAQIVCSRLLPMAYFTSACLHSYAGKRTYARRAHTLASRNGWISFLRLRLTVSFITEF